MKHLYIAVLVAVKLLTMYAYRSTDFEVHRNWLAVTSKVEVAEWYTEDGSQWTLDYPPNFAYLEWGLAWVADFFDPEMTKLENLEYASEATVIFQRCSVIAGDVLLFFAAHSALKTILPEKAIWGAVTLIVYHPGFLIVDGIHFQYNSFLYSILLFSFSLIANKRYVLGGAVFAALLCFKHIYLYMAPAYFIFLLKRYVFNGRQNPITALLKLGTSVITVVFLSFYPFLDQLPVVLGRMFPWGRGLCHAYWAPNFYAAYNVVDLVLQKILRVAPTSSSCVNTRGLVDQYSEGEDTHAVLLSITPRMSIQLTVVVLGVVCLRYWSRKGSVREEVVELAWLCALCSAAFFTFSWHVHEKAIMMVSLPLMFVVYKVPVGVVFPIIVVAVSGTLSLYPLLFQTAELPLKASLVLLMFIGYPLVLPTGSFRSFHLLDTLLLTLTVFAAIYQSLHPILPWSETLPFLPLLTLSFTSSLSLLTAFARLSSHFLSA